MKGEVRFIACRFSDGRVHLFRQLESGRRRQVLPARSQKVWNHSPDGFELGYGGSGPAQLALAMLLEAGLPKGDAVRLHQAFKMRFVAPARKDALIGWGGGEAQGIDLSRSEILTWAFAQDAGEIIPWLQGKGIAPRLPRPLAEDGS